MKFDFFTLKIYLGSPKLHMIEIVGQPTSLKNLAILAFIGAELAGGTDSAPPFPYP